MSFSTRMRAVMKHEISAADVEALLRGSGRVEDLRGQVDEQRQAGEIAHPGQPWVTHTEIAHALAHFWVAQAFIVIGRSLKEVDDEIDPGTRGYMPMVSHHQAVALLRQANEQLAIASAALYDPGYGGDRDLPVPLQPRVESEDRCPAGHLKGMLRAAQELDDLAHVEVETYAAAAQAGAPSEVQTTARRLQAELAKAETDLKTAEFAVAPILNGQSVDQDTHEGAENQLWRSLESYVWLGQVVAIPALLSRQPTGSASQRGSGHRPPPPTSGSRKIQRQDIWCLTDPSAQRELRSEGRTGWAEDELEELWGNKDWKLSPQEQEFLSEVKALEARGMVGPASYMAECPFNPVWVAYRPVQLLGQNLGAGRQFAYNHHDGKGGLTTSFRTASDFEECAED